MSEGDGRLGFIPNMGIRASLTASSKVLSRYTQAARTTVSQKSATSSSASSVPSAGSPGKSKSVLDSARTSAGPDYGADAGTGSSSLAGAGARSQLASSQSSLQPPCNSGKAEQSSSHSQLAGTGRYGHGHGHKSQLEAHTSRAFQGFPHAFVDHPYANMTAVQQERVLLELGKGRNSSWKIPLYGDFAQLVEQAAAANELRHIDANGRTEVVQLTGLPAGCITEHEFTRYMRECDPTAQAEWSKAAFFALSTWEQEACHIHTDTGSGSGSSALTEEKEGGGDEDEDGEEGGGGAERGGGGGGGGGDTAEAGTGTAAGAGGGGDVRGEAAWRRECDSGDGSTAASDDLELLMAVYSDTGISSNKSSSGKGKVQNHNRRAKEKEKGKEFVYMTQFQFLCAVVALNTARPCPDPTWLDLRRRVLFQYYTDGGGGAGSGIGFEGFCRFLNDCTDLDQSSTNSSSSSTRSSANKLHELHPPLFHGFVNNSWTMGHNIEVKNSDLTLKAPARSAAMSSFMGLGVGAANADADVDASEDNGNAGDFSDGSGTHSVSYHRSKVHSAEDLAETLALRNVQLAQKSNDLEELELLYRKLEKKMCALKLELADAKATR